MSLSAPQRLQLDAPRTAQTIAGVMRRQIGEILRRSGAVVAMSGGVDSAVCAALAARALGPRRVLGLALPERESDVASVALAREWAEQLGIDFVVEDLTAALEACGCYAGRDEAIRRVTPYGEAWRSKLVLENGGTDSDQLTVASLVVRPPEGPVRKVRLPARELRAIIAATNYKQRARAMSAYYHADRLNYAVVGTPNRLEYELAFFVKGGDGLADVKPIAHLYKTQVYQLAEYLGVPEAIRTRVPTTDTYSLPQTQEEFFFSLPHFELDVVLQARNAGREAAEVAADLGLEATQVERVYKDIERKRRVARYLHAPPLLIEPRADGGVD